MFGTLLRLAVYERSQAAEARRLAADLARSLGFTESRVGEVAIVATEMATNLVNHTRQGGEMLIAAVEPNAVEMLSIDNGPGMDLDRCLEDGYSTAGTAGTGLGAIRRLSSAFDGWSDPTGTVLLSRIDRQPTPAPELSTGAVRVPKAGETACGDNWAVRQIDEITAILIVDGLGHGAFAADAAQSAVDAFDKVRWQNPADTVEYIHTALRGTRGAAIAVAALDRSRRKIRYSGLGNASGVILANGRTQSMVSQNGTAGHNASRIGEFEYAWPEGSTVIMHTDGLATSWTLTRYPGLLAHHPSVVSGVLYRDFSRGRDDCTVITARENRR